jgi:alpha-D-xyloside xylohydrolase
MLYEEEGHLVFRYDAEEVWLQPWGDNGLRIRATKQSTMPKGDWALHTKPKVSSATQITINTNSGSIINGNITATITKLGKLTITNYKGKTLLEEYARNRRDLLDPKCSALEVEGRDFKPIPGGDYRVTLRLESLDPGEKIFGMGQYQQPYLDLKGLDIELAHRNSQASVPFALSSLGYGFLWNNPAIGRAVLGKNIMSFESFSTNILDYWIVAGDSPAEIEEAYASVTGTVPMMPEYVSPGPVFCNG